MSSSPFCEQCGKSIELVIHAVRDCDFAQLKWKSLLPRNAWNVFFNFHIGEWIHWNIMNKGMLNVDGGEWMDEIFKIEARAIVEGMKLAWLKGFKQVEINYDNAMLIDTICNRFASISNIAEVRIIHEWCNKDWKVKFRHVLRGSNKVVDCLVKAAIKKLNQVVLFPVPPQYIIRLLEDDTYDSLYEETTVSIHS
ncbi:hypothetical protein Goari_003192 [Gossypium aridum]|uniref:RNase H type-1 domain-containing protein n=2 Tax=Gossypium aridum TaxID=34290 RepID=A0A7J8YAS7_GOSAI|nr:hypothetical protein [Gossypium aridum]